jgi:hypothetical protein
MGNKNVHILTSEILLVSNYSNESLLQRYLGAPAKNFLHSDENLPRLRFIVGLLILKILSS